MFQILIGATSRIILNGHQSEPFVLQRGCRQGDPIPPIYSYSALNSYLKPSKLNIN